MRVMVINLFVDAKGKSKLQFNLKMSFKTDIKMKTARLDMVNKPIKRAFIFASTNGIRIFVSGIIKRKVMEAKKIKPTQ